MATKSNQSSQDVAQHQERSADVQDTDPALNPLPLESPLKSHADNAERRGFLKRGGLLAMATAIGASIPFAKNMPAGFIPVAFAQSDELTVIPGKEGLTILNDRPLNAETPPHLLDDKITPAKHMFVRNNGRLPDTSVLNPETWTLEIAGESCETPTRFTLAELKSRFTHYDYQLTVECGGNGRSEYTPAASGNQWTTGAVACPKFTGVRLRDVLEACGIKDDAVYIGYYGADLHLSGDPNKESISRGVPMSKALEDQTLIAWAINGEDLPVLNGYPLRLVCGGWPASTSGKWLKKIVIRDQVHDGNKMAAPAYSVPKYPVAPGTQVPNEDMEIIGSMPVKSLITFPKTGISHTLGEPLAIRGHAWAGDLEVSDFYVSIDFGTTWQQAELQKPVNRLAWQHWQSELTFPEKGYYEIWARAVDSEGKAQPMVVPGWNPKGYLNNACHRIAVQVV